MKFTPSAQFLAAANGAFKVLQWKCYVKNTTVLTDALNVGTWIDVTPYVDMDSFPDAASRIEYGIGQFISDNITIKAKNIAWWKANVFTSTALSTPSQYLEFKIELQIGLGAVLASDIAYMFCGWADKIGPTSQESDDSFTFKIFTAEDLGTRMAGENITTQYKNTNIDGASTAGLILQGIPGLFLKSANVSGKVLQVGVHSIQFQVNGANKQLKLDNATAWQNIPTSGTNITMTIGNVTNTGASDVNDTQQVQVFIQSLSAIPAAGVYTDSVVVTSAGTTLPQQWYRGASARKLLKLIYNQIGISTVNFDAMTIASYDGTGRLQTVDFPPDNATVSTSTYAVTNDGTDLYIGIAHQVYKRTTATDAYALLVTLSDSTSIIKRMFYNARNNHIWVYFIKGSGAGYAGLFNATTGAVVGNEIQLAAADTSLWYNAMALLDYNYTGASYHYALAFVDATANACKECIYSGSTTMTIATVATAAAASCTFIVEFMYDRGFAGGIRVKVLDNVSPFRHIYHTFILNSSNVWTVGSKVLTTAGVDQYGDAAWSSADSRIYYRSQAANIIRSHHTDVGGLEVTHLTLNGSSDHAEAWVVGGGKIYFAVSYLVSGAPGNAVFYSISGTNAAVQLATGVYSSRTAMTYMGSTVYGVTIGDNNSVVNGMLYQWSTASLIFNVRIADFTGLNVRDALNKVLKAFNLVGTISMAKRAFVYRRGDSSGIPQTTGNTLALGMREASDIVEVIADYKGIQYVRIIGETLITTYDGTSFNSAVLSDKNTLEINNNFVPDAIAKDICYYVYQFFKTDRNRYRVACGILPLVQYEPMDNATLSFTGKIVKSAGGTNNPIYGMTFSKDGSMQAEVLI